MNIGVIGVGGVGGYFGGKLTSLLKQECWLDLNVFFVARNKHLEAINKNGLILSTVDEGEMICRPTLSTDNIDELPELDLCLLCVKSYDLDKVLESLNAKIKPQTQIIPLLNGVDIYERIRTVISQGIVYPACVYVGTHIESYGKVVQNGGSCTILFGKDPAHPEAFPQIIFDLFNAASIKHQWCDNNPYSEIWSKYIFIAAYGMVTAGENKTVGEVLESDELRPLVLGIMNEIVAIGKKQEVSLPDTIIADSLNKASNFPYETRTSFQRDFEQMDKSDERELYGNTIIRLGERVGVQTPITRQIQNKLDQTKGVPV